MERKCEQCGKTLIDKSFTAVGIHICEDCNITNKGTIGLDLVLDTMFNRGK